jgi:GNAT superfamily N-acetyltransferase
MASTYAVRRATAADLDELLRLRRLMMALLDDPVHQPPGQADADWESASRAFLVAGLAAGTVGAFVAESEADGAVVGGGVGNILQRLSAPWNPTGRYGHIASMVTDPEWQRRGIGGRVLDELLAWFTSEGITRVELTATTFGEPIYRSRGFAERSDLAMRWVARGDGA